jgi:excisionase family DNA binding protein
MRKSKSKKIPVDVERLTFEVSELAALLGVNLVRAYSLTRTEGFPSLRIGRRILVPKRAFEEWLNRAGQPEEGGR